MKYQILYHCSIKNFVIEQSSLSFNSHSSHKCCLSLFLSLSLSICYANGIQTLVNFSDRRTKGGNCISCLLCSIREFRISNPFCGCCNILTTMMATLESSGHERESAREREGTMYVVGKEGATCRPAAFWRPLCCTCGANTSISPTKSIFRKSCFLAPATTTRKRQSFACFEMERSFSFRNFFLFHFKTVQLKTTKGLLSLSKGIA